MGAIDKIKRKIYVFGMMRAINKLRSVYRLGKKIKYTKTDALSMINRFERVNKEKFNPFDNYHLSILTNEVENESFFRSMKWKLKELRNVAAD
jgi:hypothetical protein